MPEGDERFHASLLYPVHVLAVLTPGHRLSRRATLNVEEFANEPLLLLSRGFASREWFYAVCQVARVRPRVFLESAAPHTLIALAAAGYGVAVISSSVRIPRGKVHAVPLVHRGSSIGRWNVAAWDPQRSLPPYAVQFIEELTVYTRRQYPNRDLTRRAPALPQLDKPVRIGRER